MGKKIKVIEYLEGSLSDGGAETLIKDYCTLLDKNSFEPVVLVDFIFPESANYRRLKDEDVKIVSLYPRYSLLWRFVDKFFRNRYIDWKLALTIEKLKPDVIHIHLSALKHVVKVKDKLHGIKLFYTCHSIPEVYFDEKKGEKEAAATLIKDNGLVLIALHEDMKKELEERFPDATVKVIKNGIDIEKFKKPVLTRSDVRSKLKISEGSFVLCHIGRFVPVKNHSFLLDVFQSLTKRRPDSVLVLVGTGEDRDKVENIIREKKIVNKVIILSNVVDVPSLLAASDAFILPSLFEGFGIVLVEAQAAGVKTVVSNTINSEVFLSDLIIPLSLDEPKEKWVDVLLDGDIKSGYPLRLDQYDMKREIKRLERIYRGEE